MELEQRLVFGAATELEQLVTVLASLGPDEWTVATRRRGRDILGVAVHLVEAVNEGVRRSFLREDHAPATENAPKHSAERPRNALRALSNQTDLLFELTTRIDDRLTRSGVGLAAQALWFEIFLHGDDVRDALGRESVRGPGLHNALVHLVHLLDEQSWEGSLVLAGEAPIVVGGGGGPTVQCDPLDFLLVMTGRTHPVEIGLHEAHIVEALARSC